jgi:biotin-dependent carboxylase-like uncharacterized protein
MTRAVTILEPGLLATVQDGGRYGHRNAGVAIAGALDPLALRLANRMAGNSGDCAALEITLGAARLQFEAPMRVALAGAECNATLDGEPLASWSCAFAHDGSVLQLGRPARGMRTIVALGGGVDVPLALGSRSTDPSGFGGFEGRPLRAGDVVPIGAEPNASRAAFRLLPPAWALPGDTIRALDGSESDRFDRRVRQRFWESAWLVTPQSNRMGYRLHGEALEATNGSGTLPSHAVEPGVVQVPPDGQPIVLLADAQTTGGYPKIAVAVGADRWRLAQIRIGERLRFERVSFDQARAARAEVERYLQAASATIAAQVQR